MAARVRYLREYQGPKLRETDNRNSAWPHDPHTHFLPTSFSPPPPCLGCLLFFTSFPP